MRARAGSAFTQHPFIKHLLYARHCTGATAQQRAPESPPQEHTSAEALRPLQGAWVQSLVKELESHRPCDAAKKTIEKTNINPAFCANLLPLCLVFCTLSFPVKVLLSQGLSSSISSKHKFACMLCTSVYSVYQKFLKRAL